MVDWHDSCVVDLSLQQFNSYWVISYYKVILTLYSSAENKIELRSNYEVIKCILHSAAIALPAFLIGKYICKYFHVISFPIFAHGRSITTALFQAPLDGVIIS